MLEGEKGREGVCVVWNKKERKKKERWVDDKG
jgi:hypothetical protein